MFRVNLSSIIFLLGWFFWDPCPGRSLFATKSTSVSEWCPDEWGTVHLYAPKSPWLHFNVLPFHMFVFGKCTSLNLELPCISDHIYYRWGDYGWQQVLTMIHTYSITLGKEDNVNPLATHGDVSTNVHPSAVYWEILQIWDNNFQKTPVVNSVDLQNAVGRGFYKSDKNYKQGSVMILTHIIHFKV
jgi:hypothetical protein